jgi:hypothetical protein
MMEKLAQAGEAEREDALYLFLLYHFMYSLEKPAKITAIS